MGKKKKNNNPEWMNTKDNKDLINLKSSLEMIKSFILKEHLEPLKKFSNDLPKHIEFLIKKNIEMDEAISRVEKEGNV